MSIRPESVLFIRRDNIGDLVCTTPAIRAFKERYPGVKVGLLVNSYNADIVAHNPFVDELFIYRKAKHEQERSTLGVWLENFRLLKRIRRMGFHAAVGFGGYSPRLERLVYQTGAKVRIGYKGADGGGRLYTHGIEEPREPVHEVEACMGLLKPFGITGPPPPMYIRPDEAGVENALLRLKREGLKDDRSLVLFHISSRRAENRWPVKNFALLGGLVTKQLGYKVLVTWAPGPEDDPRHPGDDRLAEELKGLMKENPLCLRTTTLKELIAAVSLARIVVCPDGGAMHIAAALGKPLVTIWGSTDPRRWAPWGVEHVIVRNASGRAAYVTVEEVFDALTGLCKRYGIGIGGGSL